MLVDGRAQEWCHLAPTHRVQRSSVCPLALDPLVADVNPQQFELHAAEDAVLRPPLGQLVQWQVQVLRLVL